ncbi:MAG: hypothetical protein AAF750_09035 [Planctomycetota bacterium]
MNPSNPSRTHSFALKFCLASATLLGTAASSHAEIFTLSAPDGTNSTAVGQAFLPIADEVPETGLGAGDVVFLNNFSFTSGGEGTGDAATRLAIFDVSFFGFNIGGTAPLEANLADAVALSTNAVDTASASDGDTLSFNFDSLELPADGTFSAVFVTVAPGDIIVPIEVSTKFVSFTEVSPGVFEPTVNLGGSGNFGFVSLFNDSNGDGFFEAGFDGQDLGFTATFSTVIPEPGSLTLAALASTLLLVRRQRRDRH